MPDPSYAPPQLNTMNRFQQMQQGAQQAAGAPKPMPIAPNVPATTVAPQPGFLQQMLSGLKSYFSPAPAAHAPAPQPPNPESPDQALRAMQELVRRSQQLSSNVNLPQ